MRNLSNKELNIGNWEYVDKKRRLQRGWNRLFVRLQGLEPWTP